MFFENALFDVWIFRQYRLADVPILRRTCGVVEISRQGDLENLFRSQ